MSLFTLHRGAYRKKNFTKKKRQWIIFAWVLTLNNSLKRTESLQQKKNWTQKIRLTWNGIVISPHQTFQFYIHGILFSTNWQRGHLFVSNIPTQYNFCFLKFLCRKNSQHKNILLLYIRSRLFVRWLV